jgi:peptidylprolyl isomerase
MQPLFSPRRLFRAVYRLTMSLTIGVLLFLGSTTASWATLPPGNAVTDGRSLLRYSLPIDSPDIQEVQRYLEEIGYGLRGKRWGMISKNVAQAARILNLRSDTILSAVPEGNRAQAEGILASLRDGLPALATAAESKDKPATQAERTKLLTLVGQVEELTVGQFPFEVPEEYRNLPQLKGRATIALETSKGTVTLVADGYSAPLTAGNFVDLVDRKFYDGLPFTRVDDAFVLQVGDPEGDATGFVDPKTKTMRTIPMEIRVDGEPSPVYGGLLEDLGYFNPQPALPFSSFGTVAMAYPQDNPNGASSQFFFFLFDSELTPAGRNLIDGRYAAFAYPVENGKILGDIKEGDRIISAKVIDGIQNLVR